MMKFKIDILIAEDEPVTALNLKYLLKSRGFNIIKVVNTGEEAISAAFSARPDVVLMERNLKGPVNGIQAAEEILDYKVPVLFITAKRDNFSVKRMQEVYAAAPVKSFDDFIKEEKNSKIVNN
jgi:DNA-binding NarL/FixJ family response regulator